MIDASFEAPKRLLQFTALFRQCFTRKTYESFVSYMSGMLLEHKRLSIQSIAAKTPLSDYGRLQYLISECKWSTDDVNKKRLEYLQGKRPLAATSDGDLIIDDSACPKPYARHTEAAEVQYAGIAGGTVRCNTFVAAVWAAQSHYFPVQIATYKPQQCFPLGKDDPAFRSKIQLAQELITYTQQQGIPFRDVLFDSWYLGKDFLNFLNDKGLTWIGEAKGSITVRYRHKWTRIDELVKIIPPDKFNRTVMLPGCDGNERTFLLSSFDTRLKFVNYKLRCVVAVGKWDERDEAGVHVFLSNRLSVSPDDIVRRYTRRWRIEDVFKELKDFLHFDQYQVRSLKAIRHMWHLALLAHSYLQGLRLEVIKLPKRKRRITLGDALALHRRLNDEEALRWMRRHPDLFDLIRLTDQLVA
ncbi:MAG: IS701 family transposase [Verrucomicrobia bacterium]|nr:IS701 family transposase [Verrucomicrobiota bacterium]